MIKIAGGAMIAALLMSLALPAGAQTQQKKIQCWTDAQGHRACGDHVPPEYAKQERKTIDSQGRTVGTRQRERTPEEVAADERAAADAAAEKARIQKQAAYDKFLTDSYSSVKDLERARNERLATLDGRVNLANQAVAGSEKSKDELRRRIDALLKKSRPVDVPQKQLRETEKSLRDNRVAIIQMQKDREHVCADFLRDIRRFQELTMGSSAYGSECPVPGSPALAAVIEKPQASTSPKKR
ncbi:MAG TPA: hypothetical protein VGE22_10450 [Solimonas sp.]